jgi:choloylglycine hydrolase
MCTGIMLNSEDGSLVHGRTAEFGFYIDTTIVVVPRGYKFVGDTPMGQGMEYVSKYAAIGIIAYEDVNLIDGMNEEGLAVGAFYFPSFCGYTPITTNNRHKALSPSDFSNWILSQFSSVSDVQEAIEAETVVIVPTLIDGWGEEPPPYHYIVYDKSGACIVIEPLNGKLVVYENPIGVITNSPTFDWQMINLRNYVALDPRNVPPINIDGFTIKQIGQGSGMLGLPGDFTPPSRFVRATVFCATSIPEKNAEKSIIQAFHILNNFDIPVGVAREQYNGKLLTDYTMLTVARDPGSLRYYYKSYDDQTIRFVDLSDFDLNANSIKMLSTESVQPMVNMTDRVK